MTNRPPTYSQLIGFRRWLLAPVLNTLTTMEDYLMGQLDQLQAAAERTGTAVRDAVVLIPDLRAKLAAAEAEIASGRMDSDRLAAIVASMDASTDSLAQALNPVVEEPQVPTGEVAPQPDTNPDTSAPESVEGSVPAGEPLPEA